MEQRVLRRNVIIKRDASLLGIGILYYIFVRITGVGIPCVFRLITKLQCPGCGITRALMALFGFHFKEAFSYNPYIFIAGPFLAYVLIKDDYLFVKMGTRKSDLVDNVILVLCTVGALAFGVIRNLLW
jgi:hypothetical protein